VSNRMKQVFLFVAVSVMLALSVGVAAPQASAATPQSVGLSSLHSVSYVAARVVVTKAPGTVGRGYYASVTVKTAPKASCSIGVYYKSGRSVAQGLYTKTASASGVVSWSWKVGTRTTPGSWPVRISCGGASATTYVRVPR
jgi:micrococcal nuclease